MTEFFDDFRFSSFSFRQTMFSVSYLSVDWRVLVWQINVLVVMLTSKKTPPAQKIWLLPPLPTKRQVWKHSTRDAHTYMYTPHTHAWHTGLLSWCPIDSRTQQCNYSSRSIAGGMIYLPKKNRKGSTPRRRGLELSTTHTADHENRPAAACMYHTTTAVRPPNFTDRRVRKINTFLYVLLL